MRYLKNFFIHPLYSNFLYQNTKQQKKHLKKEQQDRISERTQFELDRFKFMIQIQNILLKIFSKNLSLKNESANNLVNKFLEFYMI